MKNKQTNQCPQCGRETLYFSGDGRARICERCGFRVEIEKPGRTLAKLKEDTRLLPTQSTFEYRRGQANSMRLSLVQGIGAVKAGDLDEAYYCLTRILRFSRDEEDRANAWLWLSQVVSKPEERRFCLEEILAIKPTHQLAARGLAVLDGRLNPADIIDPDQYQQEISDSPLIAEAEQFTCPRCDSRLNYAADGRVLLCEFCTFEQEVDESGQPLVQTKFGQGEFEQEFTLALTTAKGHIQPVNVRTFQCHNCAVEFVLAPETISVTCPYCDGVYVTETAESDEIIPPHALIPFSIEYNEAETALRRWFKKHKIERPRVSPIVGIYLPVWTFDVGGEVKWSGLVEEGDGWVPASGSFLPFFDDILVSADTRLADALTKRFSEFKLDALVAYDARYLADWPAERYQIPLADASLKARKLAMAHIRRHKDSYLRGRTVMNFRLHPGSLIIESYKQILLPMWVVHYQVEGRVYDVTINGQTGKAHGDRPQGAVGRFLDRLLG